MFLSPGELCSLKEGQHALLWAGGRAVEEGCWSRDKCPHLGSFAPCFQFFPRGGQAHPAGGTSSAGT